MAELETVSSGVHHMVGTSIKYCTNNNFSLPKSFDRIDVENIIDSKISKVGDVLLREKLFHSSNMSFYFRFCAWNYAAGLKI